MVSEKQIELLAEYLCSEFDFNLNPCIGYSWPEHKDDDGYRGDRSYVKLQPNDVQAYARENASRIINFLRAEAALSTDAEPVAWRYRIGDGKWTVQKNKPEWFKGDMADAELEPLYPPVSQADYERRILSHNAPPSSQVGRKPTIAIGTYTITELYAGRTVESEHVLLEPADDLVRLNNLDRSPSKYDVLLALEVLQRANGADLDEWTGGVMPSDHTRDALAAIKASRENDNAR